MTVNISGIDLAIVIGYIAIIIAIGIIVARRTKSGNDLFLAGRTLTWGAIGFSLFASNISTSSLVGLAGDAYRAGIAVSAYEWMGGLTLVFAAFVIFPFFLRGRLSTIPEYLEKRFDARARKYFSAITLFLSVIVDMAGGLYAGALVAQTFIPDVNITVFIAVIAVFAGLYTAAGGLGAVVYTDVLQAIILIIGSTSLAFITFGEFDFSWAAATQALPEGHLSMIKPLDDPVLPWLGLLIGLPVLNIYYWSLNQYIVQRVLGSKDVPNAQWGAILAGALKQLPLFIMILPGAFAVSLLPELSSPDQVFPTLVQEFLPVGLTGLVIAGLLAAIMSSVDSALNSASTLLVLDFIEPASKEPLTPERQRRVGTYATLGFMVLATPWSPVIQVFPGLFSYLQAMFAYIEPPIVAIFLMGLLWPRGNARGAFWTLIIGHAFSLVTFILVQTGVFEIHFTIVAGILTFISLIIFVIASFVLGDAPSDEKIEGFTWRKRLAEPEASRPWYKDPRYQSVALIVVSLSIVIAFW